MTTKKEIQYQSLIEILKNHKGISPGDLLDQLNEKLKINNLATVKERTLDSLISDIRSGKFNKKTNNPKKPENIVFKNGHYTIENHKLNFYLSELTEEVRNTIPFLYSILSKYQYIPSVKMFYSSLKNQIEQNKESINVNSAVISINNHQKLEDMERQMKLVMTILSHIDRQEMIQFNYLSTALGKRNKINTNKEVILNPLQVRQYLGKFYLIGTREDTPYEIRTYLLDNILFKDNRYYLDGYIANDSEEIEIFNYKSLVRTTKLETYFTDCIGIMREKNSIAKEVRRWFKGWAATAVISSPLHDSQLVMNPDEFNEVDGRVLIQIKVYKTIELENTFAKFGNYSWYDGENEPST